jgi:hypothetical protein
MVYEVDEQQFSEAIVTQVDDEELVDVTYYKLPN